MAGRRPAIWTAALVIAAGTLYPAMAGAQTTDRPDKSPLNRSSNKSPLNRTKSKPPARPGSSAPKPSKPLSTITPQGRRGGAIPKQPRIQIDAEDVRRAVFGQNSVQERVRNNAGGDMDISVDGSSACVSEVFTRSGMPSQKRAMRNVVEALRDGRSPSSNEELRDIIRGGQKDLESARADYLASGFREVRMSENETIFVKADDPNAAANVVNMLEDRVSEDMYRNWLDDWERNVSGNHSWVYAGGSSGRSCGNGACSPTRDIDAFILRGTMMPVREPSESELAELEMTDAERAQNALARGDYPQALERYEIALKENAEDAPSLRGYAVALLQSNRLPEGVTKMGAAYALDPTLADQPINLDFFADGADTVTELLQRLVPMAHRSTTYSASLTAAALMQAQGRNKEAARMLERAAQKGLPDVVKREFTLAIPASIAPRDAGVRK